MPRLRTWGIAWVLGCSIAAAAWAEDEEPPEEPEEAEEVEPAEDASEPADEAAKPAKPAPTPTDGMELSAACADLEGRIAKHKQEKDEAGLGQALGEVEALHARALEPKDRKRVNGVLGTILRAATTESLEKRAIETIAKLGDDDNWKLLRPYVTLRNPKQAPRLLAPALAAVAALAPDDAVPHLLRLVEDCKVHSVCASAIEALGHFGKNERVRVRILEALVREVRKAVPGGGSRSKSDPKSGQTVAGKSGGDGSRWGTIAPAFVEAANRMTGQAVASPEDWFDLCDQYEGKLESLFSS